jgi:hypothetical protein
MVNAVVPKTNKELTNLQKNFLDALAGPAKGNLRDAMRIAGYSDNTRLQEVVVNLRQEIIDIAEQLLALNAVKAVHGLSDVIDTPGRLGASNIVNAAKEILDRVGINKKTDGAQTVIKADNVVILPPKSTIQDIKDITGQSKTNLRPVELDSNSYRPIDESTTDDVDNGNG